MTPVRFEVVVDFDADAALVWEALIDWKGHESWIPATRVEVDSPDPADVGATFTAWTGYRPLLLEDRMKVVECEWNTDDRRGTCAVEKLGPLLFGQAGFTVEPRAQGSRVTWIEDVTVKGLPRVLAPVAARIGATGFRFGMGRLGRLLEHRAIEVG